MPEKNLVAVGHEKPQRLSFFNFLPSPGDRV